MHIYKKYKCIETGIYIDDLYVLNSGVAREGTGGDSSPPVVLKTNFEIFLNLKRKGGGGGGGGGTMILISNSHVNKKCFHEFRMSSVDLR